MPGEVIEFSFGVRGCHVSSNQANAQDQMHKKPTKTLQLQQNRTGFSCLAESCCWPAFPFRQLLVAQIRFHSGGVLLDGVKFTVGLLPRYLRAGDST